MARRLFDVLIAGLGLIVLALPMGLVLVLVWRQDGRSPFYIPLRAGVGGQPFRMVKVRSMVVNADGTGVQSTSANDARITPLGHFIRRWKIDELSQLWNVLIGDMSLVGPRPNTMEEVATYSAEERELLAVRPGITDLSSIVFSDEGDILHGSSDPDRDYTLWIRPWKGALSLLYVRHPSLGLYWRIIWLTGLAIIDKPAALHRLQPILRACGASDRLCEVARREGSLQDFVLSNAPPPATRAHDASAVAS